MGAEGRRKGREGLAMRMGRYQKDRAPVRGLGLGKRASKGAKIQKMAKALKIVKNSKNDQNSKNRQNSKNGQKFLKRILRCLARL